jgi:hypothetical protein
MLFRALGECPLYKGKLHFNTFGLPLTSQPGAELYLLAFGPLRQQFSPQELDSLVSTMAERGIRMHDELEDTLHVEAADHDDDDPSDLDEIEQTAQDVRRLRPY